ncbi:hypothetical protein [Bradyrhizobium archetypum]|uniref:AP2/ERF domain-containing protein n=1 Tax=Bradyrhizobium archetypum TaxID=2721160 RepID=A0A7Y4H6Y0_9BRAD|nr:hypothetical protein [Bradyrhizobium archetypum]NOJ48424.1 hypothetical protein [Bradyrhizobium archetypum]
MLKGSYLVDGKYRAAIHTNGRTKHLGTFATAEQAHSVYLSAAKVHFGAFASDGKPPQSIV